MVKVERTASIHVQADNDARDKEELALNGQRGKLNLNNDTGNSFGGEKPWASINVHADNDGRDKEDLNNDAGNT